MNRPVNGAEYGHIIQVSLRDYFAAHALAYLRDMSPLVITAPRMWGKGAQVVTASEPIAPERLAAEAVKIADALCDELAKTQRVHPPPYSVGRAGTKVNGVWRDPDYGF